MSHRRVMVVDDDDALRDSMCELLEQDGFSVWPADSGEAALEQLRLDDEKPALILLDLMMPQMTGWQFREEQLRDPKLSDIPVVVMTASRDVQGIEAENVVFKPLKLAQLVEVVRRHTGEAPETEPERGPGPAQLPLPILLRAATGAELPTLLAGLDWVSTALGHPSTWPPTLRAAIELCLRMAQPVCIWWGEDLACVYNDAFKALLGSKHPHVLGRPAKEVWPELWDHLSPLALSALRGAASREVAMSVPVSRHGHSEEAHWDLSLSPIGDGLTAGGVWVTVSDQTGRVLQQRRAETLALVANSALGAHSAFDAAQGCAQALAKEPRDVRYALVYLLSEDALGFTLAAAAGLPYGSPLAPETISVERSAPWPLSRVCRRGVFSVVAAPGEGEGAAAVVPVAVNGGLPAVLVAGLNPAQPIDPGRRRFLEDAADHLGAALAAAHHHRQRSERRDEDQVLERRLQRELSRLRAVIDEQRGDLSREQAARREAERSQQKLERIVHQVQAGIAELDLSGRITLVNERFCEISRRAVAELRQLRAVSLLHPSDAPQIAEQLDRLVSDGTPFTAEARLVEPDGSLVWVQGSFSRLDDQHGEPKGVALVALDVTRRRFADEALRENDERLQALAWEAQKAADSERSLRERAEQTIHFSELFAGVLGHDLRNPLGAISSTAELIQMRSQDERIRAPVARIITSASRMERMISQLLDFTSIRLGRGLPLERTEVDLFEVCRMAIDEITQQYKKDLMLESAGDGRGLWDRDRLGQLLSNLFGNACQHSPPGAPVHVTLDGTAGGAVRLEVRNQGSIPPELLPRIFEPMRHASSPRALRAGSSGLGLGLYISQQIVHAHQGRISAESTDGQTGFVIDLPRAPV
ncbi:MAG: PAS domain-containing protein [Myxococcaceae bacterium]